MLYFCLSEMFKLQFQKVKMLFKDNDQAGDTGWTLALGRDEYLLSSELSCKGLIFPV